MVIFVYSNFVGWDTETFNGIPYLTGYYDLYNEEYRYIFIDVMKKPSSSDIQEYLNFLNQQHLHNFFNVWYNIRFDFESIIKYLLSHFPDDIALMYYEELLKFCETRLYENTLFYIDSKFFSVNNGDFTTKFYDLFPFFRTSLHNSCMKYLGKGKKHIDIQFDNWSWICDHLDEIIEYHKYDCKRLAQLSEFLQNSFQRLGYDFHNPISLGTLSAYNFKKKTGLKKCMQIEPYYDRIIQSYFGGLFDIWKKGTFDQVWSYDINSAYPNTISNLISMNQCKIAELQEFDDSNIFDYAYYNCNVNFKKPFKATKIGNLNYYFTGWHLGKWLNLDEIRMIMNLGWNIEIGNGIGIFCRDQTRLFHDHVTKTYANRKMIDKTSIFYYILKIYLNALYGKFKQDLRSLRIYDSCESGNLAQFDKMEKKALRNGIDVDHYTFMNGDMALIHRDILRGSISNPVYATEITTSTRLQMLKEAYRNIDSIIAFNTDSITSCTPLKIHDSDELGKMKCEINGISGTLLNVGVYAYYQPYKYFDMILDESDEMFDEKMRYYKESFRGAFGDYFDKTLKVQIGHRLIDYLQTEKTEFTLRKKNVVPHMKSCVRSGNIQNINVFTSGKKDVDINSAHRRSWKRDFESGFDSLENNISSNPFSIEEFFEDIVYSTINKD